MDRQKGDRQERQNTDGQMSLIYLSLYDGQRIMGPSQSWDFHDEGFLLFPHYLFTYNIVREIVLIYMGDRFRDESVVLRMRGKGGVVG